MYPQGCGGSSPFFGTRVFIPIVFNYLRHTNFCNAALREFDYLTWIQAPTTRTMGVMFYDFHDIVFGFTVVEAQMVNC